MATTSIKGSVIANVRIDRVISKKHLTFSTATGIIYRF